MEGEEKNEFVLYEDDNNEKEEERRENSQNEIDMITDEEYMLECARYGDYNGLIQLFEDVGSKLDVNYIDEKQNTALRNKKNIIFRHGIS